jgi:hypothetical protein
VFALGHVNLGLAGQTKDAHALIDVNDMLLLHSNFHGHNVLVFFVGLLETFLHDLLYLHLFEDILLSQVF